MPGGTDWTKHELWREKTYGARDKSPLKAEDEVRAWLQELEKAINGLSPEDAYLERYELKLVKETLENLSALKGIQQCPNAGGRHDRPAATGSKKK
jgi:hypothetical protein